MSRLDLALKTPSSFENVNMTVKEVKICGFKSYKDLVVLKLDPETNLIVGRNGSGKSNVYDAIQFVVSNKYSSLRRDIRRRLLHEGMSSAAASSAFVELVFDNSDGRFPVDQHEVSLKRVIGLKKDEYLLNNKHISKTDVDSLLETAGFSKTNPYNIVQQGKVNTLIKMHPSDRLDLCKEIAGTRIYEDRRKESLKILKDSETRREAIREIMSSLEGNLDNLSEEKEELQKFQDLDLERRSIEYAIFEQELNATNEDLQVLEDKRIELSTESDDINAELLSIQEERNRQIREIASLEENFDSMTKDKDVLLKSIEETIKTRAAFEVELSDLDVRNRSGKLKRVDVQKEITALTKEIEEKEFIIDDKTPKFDEIVAEESKLSEQLRSAELRLRELYSKQDRKRQFTSKKDRDAFLNKEIELRTQTLQQEQQQIESCGSDLKSLETKAQDLSIELENKTNELEKSRKRWHELGEQERTLISERNLKMEERKQCWKLLKQQENKSGDQEMSFKEAKRSLYNGINKSIRLGLEAIEDLVSRKNLKGVYGPILHLIEDYEGFESFYKCIETTAGNRLFHVVVEDDEIASKLLAYLQQSGHGRVTLMPLNRLQHLDIEYPTSKDAFPMIDRLHFHPRFKPAFQQIFGRTLIARDLPTASVISRKYRLDTITLDGDKVNRRGALSGGYVDSRRSRLKILKKFRKIESKLSNVSEKNESLERQAELLDQKITTVLSELQRCCLERKKVQVQIDRFQDEMESLERDIDDTRTSVKDRRIVLKELEVNLEFTRKSIASLKEELSSPLNQKLTAAETKDISSLNERITRLKQSLLSLSSKKSAMENELLTLQKTLEMNLRPRRRRLQRNISSVSREQLEEDQIRLQDEFEDIQAQTEVKLAQLESLETALSSEQADIVQMKNSCEQLKVKEENLQKELHEKSNGLDKLLNANSLMTHKKERYLKSLRELGSLPREEYSRFKDESLEILMRSLEKLNGKLKQFEHINKKAIEQYTRSTKRHSLLVTGMKEIESGRHSIESLVEHLDQQKEQDIQRTFRTISDNFSQVFSELVPGGQADLIMLSDTDSKPSLGESQGESSQMTGIEIAVQFAGQPQVHSMQQLSGGQQTIIALSFIFAIQRCDPSPFYLFDEIDSNLDAVYRTAVAGMIRNHSKDSQFICTTFRPELLNSVQKCFGVSYENKVSRVNEISSEDALAIISEIEGNP